MAKKWCKACGVEVNGEYAEATESGEIVVVDEEPRRRAVILNKGDCLCPACSEVVTYYRCQV